MHRGDEDVDVADGFFASSRAAGLLGTQHRLIIAQPRHEPLTELESFRQQHPRGAALTTLFEVVEHPLDRARADAFHLREQAIARGPFQLLDAADAQALKDQARIACAHPAHLQQIAQTCRQPLQQPLVIRARPRRQNLLDAFQRSRTDAADFFELPQQLQVAQRRAEVFDDPCGIAKRARSVRIATLDGEQVAHLGKDLGDGVVVHTATLLSGRRRGHFFASGTGRNQCCCRRCRGSPHSRVRVLFPNLGAEEDDAPPAASPPAHLSSLARAWATALEVADVDGFATDGFVAWLNTPRARRTAEARGLTLWGPDPLVVREVHDKGFCAHAVARLGLLEPPLQGAITVFDVEDCTVDNLVAATLQQPAWMARDGLVAKARMSTSGRGRLDLRRGITERAAAKLRRRGGVVVEPWLARIADYSSQWWIDDDGVIRFVGATKATQSFAGMWSGARMWIDADGVPGIPGAVGRDVVDRRWPTPTAR